MAPLLEILARGVGRPFRLNLFNRPKTERDQNRLIYREAKPALVIGIDVGMTFSGVSYALLLPGKEIKIYPVTFFRGQSQGNSRVPTVLHYDQQGKLLHCGAETMELDNMKPDERGLQLRVEWFKLLLAPGYEAASQTSHKNVPTITIPQGKRPIDLWADYLRYLYDSLKTYIVERETNGEELWGKTEGEALLALSHPNGWGGHQQDQMKEAVVKAGLVPNNSMDRERVTFVSEGEASFRWWADTEDQLPPDNSDIVVCDAGGGTIDVSSFRVTSSKPLRVKEVMESESRVSGSVFVTRAFREYAETRLRDSKFGRDDYIDCMVQKFDAQTKCNFEDVTREQRIKFGFAGDDDIDRGIEDGCFCVTGDRMAGFFQQSCDDAVEAISKHLRGGMRSHIFILGGFSESNWLYTHIKDAMVHLNVSRAKNPAGKPVAHGAVAYYIDCVVTSRIAKQTYGIKEDILFNPQSAVHRTWKRFGREDGSGNTWIPGGFRTIIKKGHPINDDDTVKAPYEMVVGNRQSRTVRFSLYKYSGLEEEIDFFGLDSASLFEEVCTFSVEIPRSALIKCDGGDKRWKAQYDVVLYIGRGEMRCYVEWQEKGKTQRSRAGSRWNDV